jgi:hypothetical protein
MAKKAKKGPKTLFDKVKELDPNFIDEVYVQSPDQLKDRVLQLSKDEEEIELARANDSEIPVLKEQLKTAGETYGIPLKAIKMKRKLIIEILGERGK